MTVNLLEPAKAALLVFVAAILQVTIFNEVDILGGYPDVVLLTLVAIALLRDAVHHRRHLAAPDNRRLLDRPLRRDHRP